MTWLTESPGLASGVGIVLLVCFVGLFFYSPNKKLLPFILGAIVIAVVPLVIDAGVETENEHIQRLVRKMARHVRQNDVDGLLRYVHPSAKLTRARIERELPTYKFTACSVTGFNSITFDDSDGRTARVLLTVFVDVDAPAYNYDGPTYRAVTLIFRHFGENGWLVTGFGHRERHRRILER